MTYSSIVFQVFLLTSSKIITYSEAKTCSLPESNLFDCFPEPNADQSKCEARGCCWSAASRNDVGQKLSLETEEKVKLQIPYCFYPSDFGGYRVIKKEDTNTGFKLHLQLFGPGGPYGNNVDALVADFRFETAQRLRVKITDPKTSRYEVPIPTPKVVKKSLTQDYIVTYSNQPFGFSVKRKSTGTVVFDSSVGGFVFSNQFLQISSLLPSHNIYGLGEHVLGLRLDTNWSQLTLFARDVATPEGGYNLYGVHPFYMNVEEDGNANGVFFLNSNAMDIILQPTPAITYRTIGGIVDLSIFLGPSPDAVVQQYTDFVGKPTLPPYWALGFHLCRWGYYSVEGVKKVVSRMHENGIPQDVQWNDIDYMAARRDFTLDPKGFSDLGSFVQELHENGMHYVLMVDPAISNTLENYTPYVTGLEQNVFVKDNNGDVLVGTVWPGNTVFPDFFHPNASIYWLEQIKNFHNRVPFDGVWIDMNEPSNFVDGSSKGCPNSEYETPPYDPKVLGKALKSKTLCMTAKQYPGLHYNVHSLYGYSEGLVTMSVMRKILRRRSLVIGRSTFSGSGANEGHWLGDNHSNWEDLYRSIAGLLNFNLFGIPLVGADICGFSGDTTEELCSRWMQLGAFYPFSRNHNTQYARDQDPAAFGPMLIQASKNALMMRYKLLPYLNTLFVDAHVYGSAVARPLFYEFPSDSKTLGIDSQFLWGEALLITPVLTKGAKSVRGYFPKGVWYDIHDGSQIISSGEQMELQGGFDRVNLHLRSGYIIPTQRPALTTTYSRKNPFGLLVSPDSHGNAEGHLYLDDGDVLDPLNSGKFSFIAFQMRNSSISTFATSKKFIPEAPLGDVTVFGIKAKPLVVLLNGEKWRAFKYDEEYKVLTITDLNANILNMNHISWQ